LIKQEGITMAKKKAPMSAKSAEIEAARLELRKRPVAELRDMAARSYRVVDKNGFSKPHAIWAILVAWYGRKAVAVWADEA